MAKFAHIALQAEDPSKTADFYKDALGLTELFRQPADTGAEGVWLSDGDIYFAIIKKGKSPEYVTGEGGNACRLRPPHRLPC